MDVEPYSQSRYRVHRLFCCRFKPQTVVYVNFTQCAEVTSGVVSLLSQASSVSLTLTPYMTEDTTVPLVRPYNQLNFLQFLCVYIIVLLFFTLSA
jgi:hypothetical protein